ncbi:hypothetical protein A6V25_22740 [Nostoc sp. ATCC 53789]|nr:hypothetical protein A6V25_22740 [Nostoc sp. ATCC 53789]
MSSPPQPKIYTLKRVGEMLKETILESKPRLLLFLRYKVGCSDSVTQHKSIQFRQDQNTCRDGYLSRLENPKFLPVAINPSVLQPK